MDSTAKLLEELNTAWNQQQADKNIVFDFYLHDDRVTTGRLIQEPDSDTICISTSDHSKNLLAKDDNGDIITFVPRKINFYDIVDIKPAANHQKG